MYCGRLSHYDQAHMHVHKIDPLTYYTRSIVFLNYNGQLKRNK